MTPNVNEIDKKNLESVSRQTLTMFQLLERARTWFEHRLREAFEEKGERDLGSADLKLIANLNCGSTYSSELARRLGVSRQAANKQVGNLVRKGLIVLQPIPKQRNTKSIVMTEKGRDLIRHAVEELNRREEELALQIGATKAAALRSALEAFDWS